MKYLNGYYIVADQVIENRLEALKLATKLHTEVKFQYHDEVFDGIKLSHLNTLNLDILYKQRAMQLREKYDYLILNYSGGSDSWNILDVFLKNNIKLDRLFVHAPLAIINKGLHNPNRIDHSNANHYSEYDYVIKPDLEFIQEKYPEITIELKDWTTGLSDILINDEWFGMNTGVMPTVSRGLKLRCFSDAEDTLTQQGLTVGSIYGVDKPFVVEKDNKFYYYFNDKSMMAKINPANPNGSEYFYSTPDLPQLTIAQSHAVFEWFKSNPRLRYLIQAKSQRSDIIDWPLNKHFDEFEQLTSIIKSVVYPNWDQNKFQTTKPIPGAIGSYPIGFRQWDVVLAQLPEFLRASKVWEQEWLKISKGIYPRYLRTEGDTIPLHTKWHLLAEF